MGKAEVEMRIRLLETMLERYRDWSKKSNISEYSQEETTDNFLDELNKLYKERNK